MRVHELVGMNVRVVQAGSIHVHLALDEGVCGKDGPGARQVGDLLVQQASDPNSPLKQVKAE